MGLHVKKGDNVLVLAGKDKGKTGKVLSANPKAHTVVVDGVNIVTKHNKPRSAQVPGGIEKTNGNIDSSNVMIICPACGKATRVAHAEANGKKIRVCKKCNASLDAKAKAEKKTKKAKAATAENTEAQVVEAVEEKPAKKTTAKSSTAKKTATKKTETATEKKPAAKKTAEKTDESSEQ